MKGQSVSANAENTNVHVKVCHVTLGKWSVAYGFFFLIYCSDAVLIESDANYFTVYLLLFIQCCDLQLFSVRLKLCL